MEYYNPLYQIPGKPIVENGFMSDDPIDELMIPSFYGYRYGWQDANGSIWVSSGPDHLRGSHWEIQQIDGTIVLIFPKQQN